ncbi:MULTISPECIES: homoserine O-succinyltransferase [unclassified Sphingobacterium]|uniref:homoserine O-acetyltransferase MetA n=1 Tax=unclassified Sphingobacterium TaxID=2609468 RepID=UPI001AE600B3|nr:MULTISPECIES: homoserine O-succinyltransferase [unclassified Sphingobacterium]MDR6736753.1 homoserine O-succinyltransferase [Sphingobacterium sp. 2149]
MPVKLPNNLPAIELLKKENIFVMSDLRANEQDIRPLRVLVLNLMPLKITTETDFIRLLSNNPLQVEMEFLRLETHVSKNTPEEHLEMFYKSLTEVKENFYDGMIITGAPVEMVAFEEVTYWNEIKTIFDWARTHVTSSLYICWASQAALYHFYEVEKKPLREKLFGVFKHTALDKRHPLFRGFDDEFYIPHSRHTTVEKDDLLTKDGLEILSESPEAGIAIASSRGGREFYLTGHSEYAPFTLDEEYKRDLEKGQQIAMPVNYYVDDNPENRPLVRWTSHANLLFNNWLNYFVYQETPFDLKDVIHLGEIKQG